MVKKTKITAAPTATTAINILPLELPNIITEESHAGRNTMSKGGRATDR